MFVAFAFASALLLHLEKYCIAHYAYYSIFYKKIESIGPNGPML
jgi:hypothetical protein